MKKMLATLVGVGMLLAATAAMATPISGSINFTGSLKYTKNLGAASANLAEATGVDFLAGTTFAARAVTGDYASVPTAAGATPVTFSDFTFAPLAGPLTLWTFNLNGTTYDFLLQSVSAQKYSIGSVLVLTGSGLLDIENAGGPDLGFDPTPGTFVLTTQGNSGELSFSSASSVPEPGTMVLLGAGFLGLAIYGKRRKNA